MPNIRIVGVNEKLGTMPLKDGNPGSELCHIVLDLSRYVPYPWELTFSDVKKHMPAPEDACKEVFVCGSYMSIPDTTIDQVKVSKKYLDLLCEETNRRIEAEYAADKQKKKEHKKVLRDLDRDLRR